MAPTNPPFVRLNDRAARGSLADIGGSGWSIAGNDVKPFPEDYEAVRFVKDKLRLNILEEASQAEYDEAHPTSEAAEVPRVVMVPDVGHQEGSVLIKAQEQARRLQDARQRQSRVIAGEDPDNEDVYVSTGLEGGRVEGGFATPAPPSAGHLAGAPAHRKALEEADFGNKPVTQMNKGDLINELEHLGEDTDGTVPELRERLSAAREAQGDDGTA